MVVHNLYLLDKDGISLVDITVGSLKIDPNLASGFFAAILTFIKELMTSDEERITDMGMLNNRLYFVYEPPQLIGVIAVDPEDDREEVTSVVKYILREFKNKYDLDNWDHDIYPFREFSKYMKEKVMGRLDDLKYSIFYKAYEMYDKYRDFEIAEEWNEQVDRFEQENNPAFMLAAGTVLNSLSSKIMGANIIQSADIKPDHDPETQLLLSNTNLNIWNKDLFNAYKNALNVLQEIDDHFSEKYGHARVTKF